MKRKIFWMALGSFITIFVVACFSLLTSYEKKSIKCWKQWSCIDEAIGVQQFLKRNISPFCLSHHSQYDSITAFFDFQNEKIFSFQVEDFRQTALLSGAASRPKNTGVF